uniref:Uncharacterized protein n=1 Tax=Cannabis sativa TaxID=3483 RepID=A0A803PYB9_CANSA
MQKRTHAKVPKPTGRKNCPSDSINQESGTREQYSYVNFCTLDLRRHLESKYQNAKGEKPRPRGNDLGNHLNDKGIGGRGWLPDLFIDGKIYNNPKELHSANDGGINKDKDYDDSASSKTRESISSGSSSTSYYLSCGHNLSRPPYYRKHEKFSKEMSEGIRQ